MVAQPTDWEYLPATGDARQLFLARGPHHLRVPQVTVVRVRNSISHVSWYEVGGALALSLADAFSVVLSVCGVSPSCVATLCPDRLKLTAVSKRFDMIFAAPFAQNAYRTPPMFIAAAREHVSSLPQEERDKFLLVDADFCKNQGDWAPSDGRSVLVAKSAELVQTEVALQALSYHMAMGADGYSSTAAELWYYAGSFVTPSLRGCTHNTQGDVTFSDDSQYGYVLLRLRAAALAHDPGVSPSIASDLAEAILEVLTYTRWTSKMPVWSPGQEGRKVELRRRLASIRGGTDADRSIALLSYMPSCLMAHPTLESGCMKNGALELGERGTASRLISIFHQSTGQPPPVNLTEHHLVSLESSAYSSRATLRQDNMAGRSVDQKLTWLGDQMVRNKTLSSDSSSHSTGVQQLRSAGEQHSEVSEPWRATLKQNIGKAVEQESHIQLKIVLQTLEAAGGDSVELDVLEKAMRGTQQYGRDMLLSLVACEAISADAVCSDMSFLSEYAHTSKPLLVGRAVARTLTKGCSHVPVGLSAHRSEELSADLFAGRFAKANFAQALANARAALEARGEQYEPEVVAYEENWNSKAAIENVQLVAKECLALVMFPGEPDDTVTPTFDNLLDDCVQRYNTYGGKPAKDQALAPGILATIKIALTKHGADFSRALLSKNAMHAFPSQATPHAALKAFQDDETALDTVQAGRPAEAFRKALDSSSSSTHVSAAEGTLERSEAGGGSSSQQATPSRGTNGPSGSGSSDTVAGRPVPEGGSVTNCTYGGIAAYKVISASHNNRAFYYSRDSVNTSLQHLGGTSRCRRVMVSYGMVRQRDACEQWSLHGEGSCHAKLTGFRAADHRILQDGTVGVPAGERAARSPKKRPRGKLADTVTEESDSDTSDANFKKLKKLLARSPDLLNKFKPHRKDDNDDPGGSQSSAQRPSAGAAPVSILKGKSSSKPKSGKAVSVKSKKEAYFCHTAPPSTLPTSVHAHALSNAGVGG